MKHLFVPYEIALKLDEKQFNEPCIAYHIDGIMGFLGTNKDGELKILRNSEMLHNAITVPMYAQVIDWFRERHSIVVSINQYKDHADDVNDPILWKSRFNYAGVPYMYVRDTYYEALNTAITKALELICIK